MTVFIGISGGTGSGKSTIARAILEHFDDSSVTMVAQDSYYKSQSHLSFEERIKTNYDHPSAFDNDLLVEHLIALKEGETIKVPSYDFTIHDRKETYSLVSPRDIIIVEGILVLDDPRLRDLLDVKIYVDTDADIRILRRLLRDINERGRSVESVIEQYLTQVRPSHMQFTEPSKRYADVIIPEGGHNQVAIDLVVESIESKLKRLSNEKNEKA